MILETVEVDPFKNSEWAQNLAVVESSNL